MSGSRTGRNSTLPEGRWQVGGRLEMGEPGPFIALVHAKDRKVPGLDGRDVEFVVDGKSASSQIVKALETKIR